MEYIFIFIDTSWNAQIFSSLMRFLLSFSPMPHSFIHSTASRLTSLSSIIVCSFRLLSCFHSAFLSFVSISLCTSTCPICVHLGQHPGQGCYGRMLWLCEYVNKRPEKAMCSRGQKLCPTRQLPVLWKIIFLRWRNVHWRISMHIS